MTETMPTRAEDRVDAIDKSVIHTNLLTYYNMLSQHHKNKLGFIATVYLTITQLMLNTPTETLKTNVEQENIVFVGMGLAILTTLLMLGILHHIVSLAIVATQRLNILKDEIYRLLPEEDLQEHFDKYSRESDIETIDDFSASKVSSLIALFLIGLIFILTFGYSFIVASNLFEKNALANMIIGMVALCQVVLIIYYGKYIISRRAKFYEVRNLLKIVQQSKSKKDCCNKLKLDLE